MPIWIWDSTGEINLWFQSVFQHPRWFMPITLMGDQMFYMVLIPFVFFVVSRRAGLVLLCALLLTYSVNSLAKLMLEQPRPFWVNIIPAYTFEGSFGLPSGHSQNAVVVWGYLAAYFVKEKFVKARFGYSIAAILILLISLSRLIVGVHFIQDVVSGLLIGVILLYIVVHFESSFREFYYRQSLWVRFFVLATPCAVLLGVAGWLSNSASLPLLQQWSETANASMALAKPSTAKIVSLEPLSLTAFLNICGYLLGLFLALSLPNSGYKTPKLVRNRFFVLLPGIAVIFAVYLVLSMVFPKTGVEGGLLRILRYGIVILFGLYLYPWAVAKLQKRAA